MTAQDQFNNTTTGYAGTVHFTSSDTGATLPANATLTNGVGTFSGTLKATGAQTFTATDTVSSSITGNAATTVNGAITIGEPSRTRWSVNQPNFASTLQVTGGTGAYTLVSSSGLPTGLTAAAQRLDDHHQRHADGG